jgi:hypothetical protein
MPVSSLFTAPVNEVRENRRLRPLESRVYSNEHRGAKMDSQMNSARLFVGMVVSALSTACIGSGEVPEPTAQRIAVGGREYSLSRIEDAQLRSNIAGSYQGRYALLSGERLHLFPDGEAVLVFWSDISETVLLGKGKWGIVENRVKMTLERSGSAKSEDASIADQGSFNSACLYVYGDKGGEAIALVSDEKNRDEVSEFLVRTVQYVDWQRRKGELLGPHNGVRDEGDGDGVKPCSLHSKRDEGAVEHWQLPMRTGIDYQRRFPVARTQAAASNRVQGSTSTGGRGSER